MGTKKIDVIQSAQIAALEADIEDLRLKLNLVVTDLQAISAKLNILIGDLNDLNTVVMAGYTTPSSPQGHGVLQEMKDYTDDMNDHANMVINVSGYGGDYCGWEATHFYKKRVQPCQGFFGAPGSGGYFPGAGGDSSTPGGTGQGGNTAHSPDAADASVNASYLNTERIVNIQSSSANKAKKLVRQTLNRLRK